MQWQLKDSLYMTVESSNNKARLVVYNGAKEYVCRKESFSALQTFAQQPTAHIFKGRLQLIKDGDAIIVQVKNEPAGKISAADFNRALKLHTSK